MRGQVIRLKEPVGKDRRLGATCLSWTQRASVFTRVRGQMLIEGRAQDSTGSVRRSGTYQSGKGLVDFRSSEYQGKALL